MRIILLVIIFVMSGCGKGSNDTTAAVPEVPSTLTAIERGQFLYQNTSPSCLSCHGNGATGGQGPDIRGIDQGTLNNAVSTGPGTMPSYSLSSDNLLDLLEYLNSL